MPRLNKREELIDIVLAHAKEKHEKRYTELGEKLRTIELILITWAFVFAGITGLYQANILNSHNKQQILTILVPMIISIALCVTNGMLRSKQQDTPNLTRLWTLYGQAVSDNFNGRDYSMSVKEELAQAYIVSEQENRRKLEGKAFKLSWASLLVVVELILVVIFIIFKDLKITF